MRFTKTSSKHRRKSRRVKTDSTATAQVNKVKNEGSHRRKITFKIKQELNQSVTKMKPTQTNRRAQRGHINHNKQLSTKFIGWEKQHQYAVYSLPYDWQVRFTIWYISFQTRTKDRVVCWWAPHSLFFYRTSQSWVQIYQPTEDFLGGVCSPRGFSVILCDRMMFIQFNIFTN